MAYVPQAEAHLLDYDADYYSAEQDQFFGGSFYEDRWSTEQLVEWARAAFLRCPRIPEELRAHHWRLTVTLTERPTMAVLERHELLLTGTGQLLDDHLGSLDDSTKFGAADAQVTGLLTVLQEVRNRLIGHSAMARHDYPDDTDLDLWPSVERLVNTAISNAEAYRARVRE